MSNNGSMGGGGSNNHVGWMSPRGPQTASPLGQVNYDSRWTQGPSMGSLEVRDKRSFQRDARVPQLLKRLEEESKLERASEVVFVPADGVNTKTYFWEYNRHTGTPKQMNLLDDLQGGVLRGTICINVSGHMGPADRDQWARTNSYDVFVKLPALPAQGGPLMLTLKSVPRSNPGGPEYATAIDIEIPVGDRLKYGPIEVLASPSGTIPAGYTEGRVYEVHPKGRPWDPASAAAPHDGIDEDFWGL